jgi:hypothetical protein
MTNYPQCLQAWFAQQPDSYRAKPGAVVINTLDNPGWSLKVSLDGTRLGGVVLPEFSPKKGEANWFSRHSDGKVFCAYGGPLNLIDILKEFVEWSKASLAAPSAAAGSRADEPALGTEIDMLQQWFSSRCDDGWGEDGGGPEIVSTAEGGWRLAVHLSGTDLQGCCLPLTYSGHVRAEVYREKFTAVCPNHCMQEMAGFFLNWYSERVVALKIKVGDVFEFRTKRGRSVAQVTHFHPHDFGLSLLRVYDLAAENDSGQGLVLSDMIPRFSCFCPLQQSVNSGEVRRAHHLPVPFDMQTFPVFRNGYSIDNHSKIDNWWLWDGGKEQRVGMLEPGQRRLPIKETVSLGLLLERIEAGWKPESDYR